MTPTLHLLALPCSHEWGSAYWFVGVGVYLVWGSGISTSLALSYLLSDILSLSLRSHPWHFATGQGRGQTGVGVGDFFFVLTARGRGTLKQ